MYEQKNKTKKTDKPITAVPQTRKRTLFAFFITSCGGPLTFYIVYMHFNPLLKYSFGYSSDSIITHNFYLSLIQVASCVFYSLLSYRIHPLKIMKVSISILAGLVLAFPLLIPNITHAYQLFALKAVFMFLFFSDTPSASIFIRQFSVLRRVTATSFLYALARALMYPITSFGLIYLTDSFGIFGLWIIIFPIISGYLWSTGHYADLENVQLPKLLSLLGYQKNAILKSNIGH